MLKPKVGETEEMSSPFNCFNIVVLPALSRPLKSARPYTPLHSGRPADSDDKLDTSVGGMKT